MCALFLPAYNYHLLSVHLEEMRQSNTLPLASPSESISPEYYQGSQNLANATIPLF